MVVWEALDALSHQLELCKIGPERSVAVVIDAAAAADRAALVRAAVARTGADAVELRPIRNQRDRRRPEMLHAALSAADIVIVATDDEIAIDRTEGQQILYLCDIEPHVFAPHASLRRRVESLRALTTGATSLVLADTHGTDLRITLTGAAVDGDHGLLDSDHLVARFPAGWVAAVPRRSTVSGQLVIMPGDANLGANRVATSPVVLQIVDDHVSVIDGDSPDADVLRAVFEYQNEPNAYGVAEISVGMNPGITPAAPFDARLLDSTIGRLLAGVVTISFGENLIADRPCQQRVTLALPTRTVHIDGLPVVSDGQLDGDFAPDVYEL